MGGKRGTREFGCASASGARLTIKAPEIPGDSYRASLTTPFASPDQAATVARVMLMLDAALQSPAG